MGRGTTRPHGTLAYTYDGVGNRLTSTLGTATDTYIYPLTSNRLSTINLATGGTRGFTYDAAGNVTSEARPGGTYGYTYNAAGRMSEFRINGVLQSTYRYDAMGRQAIRTLSSPTAVTIHSVFDSQGRRIAEYNEGTGALIREYVWPSRTPVAVIEGGVISFVRGLSHRPPGLRDQLHRCEGLDRHLHPLQRRPHLYRSAPLRPLPRPVVPVRERPPPELDARLRPDDREIPPARPAGPPQHP